VKKSIWRGIESFGFLKRFFEIFSFKRKVIENIHKVVFLKTKFFANKNQINRHFTQGEVNLKENK